MSRVLVTGATGFIGSRLAARLVEDGADVTCLVRNPSRAADLQRRGARLVTGDLRNPDAVRAAVAGNDVVYHLAGMVTAFRQQEMMATNADGFRTLMTACADCATPPTVVSVSSLAAAGPSSVDRPRTESDPARPVSNYGRTKRAAELIAEEFAGQVPITIIRPPIVYGEGDQNMLSLFRSIFRLGVHLAFGVAYSRYSLIHVSDLVDAMILTAQSGERLAPRTCEAVDNTARGYYFVAGDEQPTFAELGPLIGAALGRARVLVCRSSGTLYLWPAAAVAEVVARLRGQPFIFNFDKAREARAGSWTCSSGAIRSQLGFAPQASLSDRLKQTAAWYRQQGLL